MSAWEWQYALGFCVGLVVGILFGAWGWWKGTEQDRELDLLKRYEDGRFKGLSEGMDKGYLQAEEAQRQRASARAHKAARTRAERKAS